jgi:hypothetical protein
MEWYVEEAGRIGDLFDAPDYDYEKETDDEPWEAWHDGSEIGCSMCPDDECTGHCMSCSYRNF